MFRMLLAITSFPAPIGKSKVKTNILRVQSHKWLHAPKKWI